MFFLVIMSESLQCGNTESWGKAGRQKKRREYGNKRCPWHRQHLPGLTLWPELVIF